MINLGYGVLAMFVCFAVTYLVLEIIFRDKNRVGAEEVIVSGAKNYYGRVSQPQAEYIPAQQSLMLDEMPSMHAPVNVPVPVNHSAQSHSQQINYYITQNMVAPEKEEAPVAPVPVHETVTVVERATFTPFITRREIAERTRALGNRNITVSEYSMESQIPMSLKWKSNTYAMLYADDLGLLAILALDKEFAKELSKTHPDIHHPKFPKGAYWYALKINDKTFDTVEDVYKLLDIARAFIEFKPKSDKKPKTPHLVNVSLKTPVIPVE